MDFASAMRMISKCELHNARLHSSRNFAYRASSRLHMMMLSFGSRASKSLSSGRAGASVAPTVSGWSAKSNRASSATARVARYRVAAAMMLVAAFWSRRLTALNAAKRHSSTSQPHSRGSDKLRSASHSAAAWSPSLCKAANALRTHVLVSGDWFDA